MCFLHPCFPGAGDCLAHSSVLVELVAVMRAVIRGALAVFRPRLSRAASVDSAHTGAGAPLSRPDGLPFSNSLVCPLLPVSVWIKMRLVPL